MIRLNKEQRKKAVFASIAGNILEYYDFTLYGFFAPVLASLFFPAENVVVSIIASMGTFAAGFVMRPLGGIFFGHFGDKYGRRNALALSILLVTVPTFTIGILPTYETIGIFAPLILVLCRLLQGICVGGEYTGSAVFIAESYSKSNRVGFMGSILTSAAFIGSVIGTSIGAIFTLSFMPEWCWRIPFLLGAVFGLLGFYIRYKVNESPEFKELKNKNKIVKFPLLESLKEDRKNLICTFGIGSTLFIPIYTVLIYMNIIFVKQLEVSISNALIFNTLIMTLWVIILPIGGFLSDKVGKRKFMSYCAVGTIIFSYPLFVFIYNDLSVKNVIIAQIVLGIFGISYIAPTLGLLPELFPAHRRYSGLSFSYSLGAAIFGGTTPMIITWLVYYTGNEKAPAIYLIIGGIIAWISVRNAKTIKAYRNVYIPRHCKYDKTLVKTLNNTGYNYTKLNEYTMAFIDFAESSKGSLLDVGCGYGFVTLEALKRGASITACDMDIRHLQILESNIPKSMLNNLNLKLGRFPEDINFSKEKFDAILFAQVLHFLTGEEIEKGILKAYEWLKPNGKIFMVSSTPHIKALKNFQNIYKLRKQTKDPWPGEVKNFRNYCPGHLKEDAPNYINSLDEDTCKRIFTANGFTLDKLSMFSYNSQTSFISFDGQENIGLIATANKLEKKNIA